MSEDTLSRIWNALTDYDRATLWIWFRYGTVGDDDLTLALKRLRAALCVTPTEPTEEDR